MGLAGFNRARRLQTEQADNQETEFDIYTANAKELKEYAKELGIELKGKISKPNLIALLESHLADEAGDDGEGETPDASGAEKLDDENTGENITPDEKE